MIRDTLIATLPARLLQRVNEGIAWFLKLEA
jgi:hypothetical protein